MKNQYRFFVERDLVSGCNFIAGKELSYQLGRILRLADGDTISLFGTNRKEFLTGISFNGREITLSPLKDITVNREPQRRLTFLLSLSKKDKPEFVVQKCTELGAAAFIFVCTEHSVVKTTPDDFEIRRRRLLKIACEAAEQSGRITIPDISFCGMNDIDFASYDKCIVCGSPESDNCLIDLDGNNILIAIGPEGGFSEREMVFFDKNGFLAVSLGGLVLRAETAAIAAAASLLI